MKIEAIFLLLGTWMLKLLAGLIVLWVGLKLAHRLKRIVRERLLSRAVDRTVAVFLSNITTWALRIGVIKAQGYLGIVNEIQIFHTVVKTHDNVTIFMPNGPLCGDTIENLSLEELRRCDFTFSIGYSDDIDAARETIREIVRADTRALQDLPGKEPFIAVTELAENSVDFSVRVWTKASDLWPFRFATLEGVKKAFDERGISIPFPQRDVHLHGELRGS